MKRLLRSWGNLCLNGASLLLAHSLTLTLDLDIATPSIYSFPLWPCSAERYGELCPLLAPVYFAYGDVLLRIVESKADAMGEGGAAGAAESDDDDDDDDEEEENGGDNGASGSSASSSGMVGVAESKGAAPGEDGDAVDGEDKEDKEGEDSDNAAAFENLEVARVLYKKLAEQARSSSSSSSSSSDASAAAASAASSSPEAAKAAEVKLARVHVRLGDSLAEDDKFAEAMEEYKAALALRASHLPRHHRSVAKALTNIAVCYLQQGSASGVDEGSRRTCLTQSLLHFKVRRI